MTRNKRNEIIAELLDANDISREESFSMITISSIIGDDDEVDFDIDDIAEAISEDIEGTEEILDTMYETNILSLLLLDEGIMG